MKGRLPDLRADLSFLQSRVNAHSDPVIQKFISQCQEEIQKAERTLQERRLVNLGHRRPYPPWGWRARCIEKLISEGRLVAFAQHVSQKTARWP